MIVPPRDNNSVFVGKAKWTSAGPSSSDMALKSAKFLIEEEPQDVDTGGGDVTESALDEDIEKQKLLGCRHGQEEKPRPKLTLDVRLLNAVGLGKSSALSPINRGPVPLLGTHGHGIIPDKAPGTEMPQMQPIRGVALIIFSCFLFSLMSCCVKFAKTDMTLYEITFYRALWGGVTNYFLALIYRTKLWGPSECRMLLIQRGIFGAISLMLGFSVAMSLSLGDTQALNAMTPVFTFFLAAIFLKESVTKLSVCSALVAFIGILFIARPQFLFGVHEVAAHEAQGAERTMAIVLAIVNCFFGGASYVVIRKLAGMAHPLVIVHYFNMASLILTFILGVSMRHVNIPSSAAPYLTTFFAGLLGGLGQFYMTRGMALIEAGPAAVIQNTSLVFGFLSDAIIFHGAINPLSVLGAFILAISALIVTVEKMRLNNKAASAVQHTDTNAATSKVKH